MSIMRTDNNNNPTAFTCDIAREAGLMQGVDYVLGDSFIVGETEYFTAKLLRDPIKLTIKVIDAISFYASSGSQRWSYIGMPKFVWNVLSVDEMRDVIGFMYRMEGGIAMKNLFPNWGSK